MNSFTDTTFQILILLHDKLFGNGLILWLYQGKANEKSVKIAPVHKHVEFNSF